MKKHITYRDKRNDPRVRLKAKRPKLAQRMKKQSRESFSLSENYVSSSKVRKLSRRVAIPVSKILTMAKSAGLEDHFAFSREAIISRYEVFEHKQRYLRRFEKRRGILITRQHILNRFINSEIELVKKYVSPSTIDNNSLTEVKRTTKSKILSKNETITRKSNMSSEENAILEGISSMLNEKLGEQTKVLSKEFAEIKSNADKAEAKLSDSVDGLKKDINSIKRHLGL